MVVNPMVTHAHFRLHLMEESHWVRLWRQLHAAAYGAYKHNCFGIAKGAAYSALLSFFPVLTSVAAILVQVKSESVAHTIASFLYEVVPPGTEDVVRDLFFVHGQRPKSLLVVAVVLAAFAASGAMMSLMEGFDATYQTTQKRSPLHERGVAILLVFTTVLPLWGASALIVFGERAERAAIAGLRLNPQGAELTGWVSLAGLALRYGIAFATVVLITAVVYLLGANRKLTFVLVLPGAVLATVLWLLATMGFAWYVRHLVNYNVLYGSVGAGLALLVWMYVLAVINLFGCEFNAARERDTPSA
jgi:membrane protein